MPIKIKISVVILSFAHIEEYLYAGIKNIHKLIINKTFLSLFLNFLLKTLKKIKGIVIEIIIIKNLRFVGSEIIKFNLDIKI